jgi:DNA-binding IclR family transcriptional regulator
LKAMVTGSFNERSLTGLSRDTGLPKSEVNACVTSLMRKGLVQQRTGQRSGQPRWFPTEAGRLLAGG